MSVTGDHYQMYLHQERTREDQVSSCTREENKGLLVACLLLPDASEQVAYKAQLLHAAQGLSKNTRNERSRATGNFVHNKCNSCHMSLSFGEDFTDIHYKNNKYNLRQTHTVSRYTCSLCNVLLRSLLWTVCLYKLSSERARGHSVI